jgi:hypothetical protein
VTTYAILKTELVELNAENLRLRRDLDEAQRLIADAMYNRSERSAHIELLRAAVEVMEAAGIAPVLRQRIETALMGS